MNATMDAVLTLEDAAVFLSVGVDVIQGLLEAGEIPGRKVGGEWRTTTRAIVNYVDGISTGMTCCTTPDGSTVCCPPGSTGCC